ncbi:hypothetical protein C8046_05120 [Serinibacter arcticus]|uniref:Uncharacterized protein n=1 Tax=Serinibacter arcticus TaxID=1655435 RepID=A0A2U1ZT26_9MICO|nr:hypothetical protein [Serinibacter arcticus]PWD50139.1 hypothetical protein C8046_05120 [Serinibacter arcticus]
MSSTQPAPGPVEPAHSCEHCSAGGGAATDPAERAREHIAIARRRVVPRCLLGALGLGVSLVLGARADQPLAALALVFVVAALAWLGAAWAGVVMGAAVGARRGPWARLALGQVLAAGLAPVTALLIALAMGLASLPDGAGVASPLAASDQLRDALPYGVAAAAGWFLASAVAEVVKLRAMTAAVGRQDPTGLQARAEAHHLTTPALQRVELVALAVALGYGAVLLVLVVLPWAAVVLAPLAAAGAALLALRSSDGAPASTPATAAATDAGQRDS